MYKCMYVYTYIYIMLTSVHHLLKKKLMMRSTAGVICQVVNMGIKFNLLIAESAAFKQQSYVKRTKYGLYSLAI